MPVEIDNPARQTPGIPVPGGVLCCSRSEIELMTVLYRTYFAGTSNPGQEPGVAIRSSSLQPLEPPEIPDSGPVTRNRDGLFLSRTGQARPRFAATAADRARLRSGCDAIPAQH